MDKNIDLLLICRLSFSSIRPSQIFSVAIVLASMSYIPSYIEKVCHLMIEAQYGSAV